MAPCQVIIGKGVNVVLPATQDGDVNPGCIELGEGGREFGFFLLQGCPDPGRLNNLARGARLELRLEALNRTLGS